MFKVMPSASSITPRPHDNATPGRTSMKAWMFYSMREYEKSRAKAEAHPTLKLRAGNYLVLQPHIPWVMPFRSKIDKVSSLTFMGSLHHQARNMNYAAQDLRGNSQKEQQARTLQQGS
jgi:hypothetical protein